MTTAEPVTAMQMTYRPMELRHAVQGGSVVPVSHRGIVYGYMVPAEQWRALTNEQQPNQHGEGNMT